MHHSGPGVFTVCTLAEVSNKVQGGRAEVQVSVLQHHQSVCIKAADPSVNSPGYEPDVSLHVYTLTQGTDMSVKGAQTDKHSLLCV